MTKLFILIFLFSSLSSAYAEDTKMISCKAYEKVDKCFSKNMNSCPTDKVHKLDGNKISLFKHVKEKDKFEIYEREKGNWVKFGKQEVKDKPYYLKRDIKIDSGFVRTVFKKGGVMVAQTLWIDFLNPEFSKETRFSVDSSNTDISLIKHNCKKFEQ